MNRRKSLSLLIVVSFFMLLLPAPTALAHGDPCRASDEWNPGTASFVIKGVWTCGESHYKYKIRSYVQTRLGPGAGWYNVLGTTSTNTKYQTTFIKDLRGSTYCIPGVNPFQEYRVNIDFAHVWNKDGKLLTSHSTEGWQGPGHVFNCGT